MSPIPPKIEKIQAKRPNVVLIVLDDVGFAQLGCFGSPIATPNIDRLASEGLRFNRFHVTSICSSTRAALLTGRNHHAVGVGMTMETPLTFPGYTGRIPPSAALLPRILRDNGYNTFASGKWHLVPRGEYSAAGPMTRWPLGQHMGFERYYGFLGAETNHWAPELCRDNTVIDAPQSDGYHLTEDLADQAIKMVRDQRHAAPDKPFFLYFATGAAHAPHHVAREWADAYAGRFDAGWEVLRERIFRRQLEEGVIPAGTRLTERPAWVPDWSTLSEPERRLFARYMEVFAGFLTHTDAQIGRLLDDVVTDDNTIVILLSDNGASAEGTPRGTLNETLAWMGETGGIDQAVEHLDDIGGPRAFNHYPWGWAWAGNTPLQLWKRYAWLGGVRTPLIVTWPGHLADPGSIRPQFCHAIDIAPTLLDVFGIEQPGTVDGVAQLRVDGASIAPALTDPGAPSPRETQYFEMHGSRGICHRGWKATTDYVSPLFSERDHIPGSTSFETDHWALFNLDEDFAEAVDLSADFPERAKQLQELWQAEAEANQVFPLFEGPSSLVALHPAEYPPPRSATYQPGGGPIYEGALPSLFGGFTITASIEEPGDGIICAIGDWNEGLALYVMGGVPVGAVVASGAATRLAGGRLPTRRCEVGLSYGAGTLALSIDGSQVASVQRPGVFFPGVSTAAGGLLIGRDRGLPVSDDYTPPFSFSGVLTQVTVTSGGVPTGDGLADVFEQAQARD
jgi:arylsulfatase A-like enzyme